LNDADVVAGLVPATTMQGLRATVIGAGRDKPRHDG
jgi:hypothetical protein